VVYLPSLAAGTRKTPKERADLKLRETGEPGIDFSQNKSKVNPVRESSLKRVENGKGR